MNLGSRPVILFFLGVFMAPLSVSSQFYVTEGSVTGLTPAGLVRDWLTGAGVTISNVTLNGRDDIIANNNAGYFTASGEAFEELNMASGILLTTGRVSNAIGPNDKPNAGFRSNSGSDPDLELLTGSASLDACILEFDFIPQCDTLSFRFAFGSEEFYEFCGQSINDAFGFFLSGPGIQGSFSRGAVNLATLPSGTGYITITSICNDASSAWNNANGTHFQYDVITHVVTARRVVTPGLVYHLKFAICDDLDYIFDSGVFLEKGSFSAGTNLTVNHMPIQLSIADTAVEGCNDMALIFRLGHPVSGGYAVYLETGGTAHEGMDYEEFPDSVFFPEGSDSIVWMMSPVADGIEEGNELFVIRYQWKTCSGIQTGFDTLIIADRMPISVSLGSDITLCPDDSVHLTATITGGFGPFAYEWPPGFQPGATAVFVPDKDTTLVWSGVSDRCGDMDSDTISVFLEPVARLTNDPPESHVCSGHSTGITLNSNITSAGFQWDPVATGGQVTGSHTGTGNSINQVLQLEGIHPGWVDYLITVSGNGCDTTTTLFRVEVNPLPVVELGPTVYALPGSGATLHAGPGYSEYRWSDGSVDSVLYTGNPGRYWVTISNQYGCNASDSIMVAGLALYVPNAFSPDGDGLNDRFRINGFEPSSDALMQIYNRWGVLLFETHHPGEGWDGTTRGEPCQEGVYIWVIRYRSDHDGEVKGTVTITRSGH